MPECIRCSHAPEMTSIAVKKVSDIRPGSAGHTSSNLRHNNHPVMAAITMAIGLASSAANYFGETRTYQCPSCGRTETKTQWKNR